MESHERSFTVRGQDTILYSEFENDALKLLPHLPEGNEGIGYIHDYSTPQETYAQFAVLYVEVMYQIAKFMGPTWGPPGSCRPQMGPMSDPRTLLSGVAPTSFTQTLKDYFSGAVALKIIDEWIKLH